MPLQLTRQQQLLRESMRRERPYGPENASVATQGKDEKRHFRQSHCHDSYAAPYTFVLMLDMVREAWEDQSRHRQVV